MKQTKLLLTAILAVVCLMAKADEGMWMLQLMKEQHLIDQMKKQGLKLDTEDIYSPNQVSLKDAVGIFGGGCTGEIISEDGLILTNHHCGFDAIQKHSSVEHDYLKNGFWSMSREEELPSAGLQFTFIERIQDVTEQVNQFMKEKKLSDVDLLSGPYLRILANQFLDESDLKGKPGIVTELLPFYAGNQYYLFFKKIYPDIRMVAAPPQSIGKFGGETDNWMWPRHTCDFSMFRIYADKNGEPAPYSPENVPLKCKKHLTISLKGLEEGDYAMILGFPGSTQRYLTGSEIQSMMESENEPRIKVRGARQDVLKEEMAKSDKVRIQYASKYARSSNYWKNSIGMNKAIIDNNVLGTKAEQEARFAEFAKAGNHPEYQNVVNKIDEQVASAKTNKYVFTTFMEVFRNGIEFGSPIKVMENLKKALTEKNKEDIEKYSSQLQEFYETIHNKDYDHEVDRKVAKALLPLYAEMTDQRPDIYNVIEKQYKGDYNRFVDDMYDNSILSSQANLNKFLKKPTVKAIEKDLATQYSSSKNRLHQKLYAYYVEGMKALEPLHKIYVRGLCEMYAPTPKSADANFSLRLTYGNVKSYSPKDGVLYNYYTTLKGVMEKEDPNNPEFIVPEKLKELYKQKDYGRYAMKNGELPTCFLTTNDITGGNSGSPVINGYGELIGCAFDGNWESLSGDINFDDELQRCIAVDIRYVLFIIEKLGGCQRLINEMTIVE